MTPKRIVEKITAFTLSGMIALSSIAVGSITNTNKISAAQTNTKKTGASYNSSWYGKSYSDIVKLYTDSGGDIQIYNDCVVDQEDLQEVFSAIRKDDTNNILHIINVNENSSDKLSITEPLSIPSNTFIKVNGTIDFETSGRFTIKGAKNICIQSADSSNKAKFITSGKVDKNSNIINVVSDTETKTSSNNIVVRNIDFSTNGSTKYYNSSYIYANNSTNLAFSTLHFEGNIKRVYSCSEIANSKFVNNTISNLSTADNESVMYISNAAKNSNNLISNFNLNNTSSTYGISIMNSNDITINNAKIDGNKKLLVLELLDQLM